VPIWGRLMSQLRIVSFTLETHAVNLEQRLTLFCSPDVRVLGVDERPAEEAAIVAASVTGVAEVVAVVVVTVGTDIVYILSILSFLKSPNIICDTDE
jgi:hypothetical protein